MQINERRDGWTNSTNIRGKQSTNGKQSINVLESDQGNPRLLKEVTLNGSRVGGSRCTEPTRPWSSTLDPSLTKIEVRPLRSNSGGGRIWGGQWRDRSYPAELGYSQARTDADLGEGAIHFLKI